MGVEINGLDEFEKMLADAEKRQRGAVNQFLAVEAELLLGKVKNETPTDTHELKNNWARSDPNGGMVVVYNNTDYADHVEYGYQQKKRWIPGVWKGKGKDKKFVYIEGAKTGMMLQEKKIPGVKMLRKSVLEQKEDFKSRAQDILKEMFK